MVRVLRGISQLIKRFLSANMARQNKIKHHKDKKIETNVKKTDLLSLKRQTWNWVTFCDPATQ